MKINIHSLPAEDEMDSMEEAGSLDVGLSHQRTVSNYEKPVRYSRQGHRCLDAGTKGKHDYDN